MRIAHVSDCYLPRMGGIERQVSDLAANQTAAGHDVEIITSVGAEVESDTGALRVHRPAPRGDAGHIRYARTSLGLRALRAGSFDLVHVHLSTWSPLALLAARHACVTGVPVAATVHSMWAYATPAFRSYGFAAGWRRSPIAWSAVSHAVTAQLRTVLRDVPVEVIPNGVNPGWWMPPPPAAARDPRRVVIGTVMRLVARKRPLQLAHMLAALRARVPERIRIEALIIGDGPLRRRLESALQRLGIDKWVRLTGALGAGEIRGLYRDVDLYVAPALLESFGIATLEARSAGLPVVAFRNTGVAEFVRDGANGLLAADDDNMVTVLRRLVLDSRLRTAIAAHNRAQRPVMGWPYVLERHDRLYSRARRLRRGAARSLTFAGAAP